MVALVVPAAEEAAAPVVPAVVPQPEVLQEYPLPLHSPDLVPVLAIRAWLQELVLGLPERQLRLRALQSIC